MEKQELLKALKHISDTYLKKKDYISAGQINRAIDVVEDFDGELPKEDISDSSNIENNQHLH